MKYSVCITHFNCVGTLAESLQSIEGQIDSDTEIVIADNKSTDGSETVLREYEKAGKIKLIQVKCSRGLGRQKALESSSGDYVISGFDMDDTFRPALANLLRFYHDSVEGNLLSGFGEATMIAPRTLLNQLGGWRDLQFRENWELCRRAARTLNYRWTIFPLVKKANPHQERKGAWQKIKYRYVRYRENLRVGHKQFDESEKMGLGQRMVWTAARASIPFVETYKADFPFTAIDPRFFVDSRKYWTSAGGFEKEREFYRIGLGKELVLAS